MELEKNIYKKIVRTGIYDSAYNFIPQMINEEVRGTSMSFALLMAEEMKKEGIKCNIISTNDKQIFKCAVLYFDSETNNLLVIDPGTEIKNLTDKGLSSKEKDDYLNNGLQKWNYDLKEYILLNGAITIYDYISGTPLVVSNDFEEIQSFLTKRLKVN